MLIIKVYSNLFILSIFSSCAYLKYSILFGDFWNNWIVVYAQSGYAMPWPSLARLYLEKFFKNGLPYFGLDLAWLWPGMAWVNFRFALIFEFRNSKKETGLVFYVNLNLKLNSKKVIEKQLFYINFIIKIESHI